MVDRLTVSPLDPGVAKGLPRIGITMGDPAGVGPEIIVKALSNRTVFRACCPVVFGDEATFQQVIRRLDLGSAVEVVAEVPAKGYSPGKVFVLSPSHPGEGSGQKGKGDQIPCYRAVGYVEEAVRWVRAGRIDAITTCPIRKEAFHKAGYEVSGHTELLAQLANAPAVAMMFVGSKWKIVLATTHLPLRQVWAWITKERVFSTIRLTEEGLRNYFQIERPRIAVLGLNPHAGEKGLLGEEEEKEILPAIREATAHGMDVEGPFSADGFFGSHSSYRRTPFDAVVAMYHDQGLIPMKILDFRGAVNLTLGLPFIRTSVGHGTADDIAGKGLADPSNLTKAILLASDLARLKGKIQ